MMNAARRLAISLLMIVAAILFCALLGANAQAQGRQIREPVLEVQQPAYDAQLAAERRELLRIMGRTRVCMFESVAASRREIARVIAKGQQIPEERQEIMVRQTVKQICGGQIRPFLVRWAKWSEADADAFVDELVERSVADATSWGAP